MEDRFKAKHLPGLLGLVGIAYLIMANLKEKRMLSIVHLRPHTSEIFIRHRHW